MCELIRVKLPPDKDDTSGLQLGLWHYLGSPGDVRRGPRKPVLLLHGASGNHRTFMVPNGAGLAAHLANENFDPWLLDWRGSGLVVEDPDNKDLLEKENGELYNVNLAARHDVRRAIRMVQGETKAESVAALGFCMGSAVLAEAVALGNITAAAVDCVVLMTLGLFYETPIDGRLKCEDRILESLKLAEKPFLSVDPRVEESKRCLKAPWPERLDDMYKHWPEALRSHADPVNADQPFDPVAHMCNRLSFMYGMPYHHDNLVDEIHAAPAESSGLPHMFGAIPAQMYIHGGRNIREGQATFFKHSDGSSDEFVSDEARGRFRALKKVTLITGALNRLWHRDSIDLMYEWLTRGTTDHLGKFHKHILPTYGHQDLLWGRRSHEDVFPKIVEGLSAARAVTTT